jgi:hypothetical protein
VCPRRAEFVVVDGKANLVGHKPDVSSKMNTLGQAKGRCAVPQILGHAKRHILYSAQAFHRRLTYRVSLLSLLVEMTRAPFSLKASVTISCVLLLEPKEAEVDIK